MKRTFVHRPTIITVYEFTGDHKEITDVLETINDYCEYDKYGWEFISNHESPFIEIYTEKPFDLILKKGDFLNVDEDGELSIFSREEMFEEWEPVEADENS